MKPRFEANWPAFARPNLVTVFTLALAACAGPVGDTLTSPPVATSNPLILAEIIGDTWQVETIDGEPIADHSTVTITFSEDNRVTGNATCNRYAGEVTVEGDRIRLGPMIATRMACLDDRLNAQELRFLDLLGSVEGIALTNGSTLVLTAETGEAITATR